MRAAVRSYSTHDPFTDQLSIFLVNSTGAPRATVLTVRQPGRAGSMHRWVLSGASADDPRPVYGQLANVWVDGGSARLTLEPYSVTVVTDLGP